ncbi:MAG: DUF4065 domain-containing protein [Ruminococcus sp.]|nr:DUF4065 domain-containing protein [Ruminococcus sp.]
MSAYEHIIKGLTEAVEYAKGSSSAAREMSVDVSDNIVPQRQLLSAFDVADWLISHNNAAENTDLMTGLKLQKLLYYAQGTAIKYTGSPLFFESIAAWELGPVVPEVYNKYKAYGRKPIDEPKQKPLFDNDTEAVLADVLEEYGQFSASKLLDMTHAESPWKDTPKNSVITLEKMRDFFGR